MSFNDYPHKVGWCKMCSQGWLVIAKEVATAKLWIICAECDTPHSTPKEMVDGKIPQHPHKVKGPCEPPSTEEIIVAGWDSYVLDLEKVRTLDELARFTY